MTWVKLDDLYPEHPKVVAAGPLAKSLFVDVLCYASRHMTDGVVSRPIVRRLALEYGDYVDVSGLVQSLIDAGLLDETDGGLHIHGYLEHQRSAEQIRSERESARERMANRRRGSPDVRPNTVRSSPDVRSREQERETDTPPDGGEPPVVPQRGEPADAGGGQFRTEGDQVIEIAPSETVTPAAEAVGETTPTGSAPPPSTPLALVEAWAGACSPPVRLVDLGETGRKKQFAIAKRLVDDGLSATDVAAMVGWLATQEWRQGGIDLLTVESQRARWLSAGKPTVTPPPPKPPPRTRPRVGYDRNDLIAIGRGDRP